ncbi:venom metalloproteinase antarease-like TtrivMP_A isoform X2 [Dermacentor silvarum]|uniref:venom metalloproteinase antarease-like TtrivMP_A isoform X2 n=1 Tax=Dermacentor silvarum TaxID=543639 RepID=UPI0021018940|nr:venom metalloproteinase antarease-like TtrivMP_A isoform X2 [Dermacentor silvarum]
MKRLTILKLAKKALKEVGYLCSSHSEKGFLVYPTILQERTTSSKYVLQLNDAMILNLEKSAVLADKLLMATRRREGSQIEEIDTSALQDSLYHDARHQSSVIMRMQDGTAQVEGIINSQLRIKPLPNGERSLQGEMPHLVYEVQEKKERVINFGSGRFWEQILRQIANMGYFVVELHVVSDREHQKYFKTNDDLIAYMAVMTNAVNLRYLDMKRPRIKFMLVGVTRSLEDGFAKIIDDAIIGAETLEGLIEYYKEGRISGAPDLVHLITGRDMARYENGTLDRSYNGISNTGAVCTKYAVGLSEDAATSFLGVHVMAHELAHVLGALHDDFPKCPWSEGYLMSYVDGGIKRYRLSLCSEEAIRNTVKKLPWQCIMVLARTNYMSRHKALPGQKVSAEHYCREFLKEDGKRENVYSVKSERLTNRCKMDCCYSSNHRTKICLETDILDGMGCGNGKTCRRGICGNHTYPQL